MGVLGTSGHRQARMAACQVCFFQQSCAFDLLKLNGDDLRRQPLRERKLVVGKLLLRSMDGIQDVEHAEGVVTECSRPCADLGSKELSANGLRQFIRIYTIKRNPEGLLLLAAGAVLMLRTNGHRPPQTASVDAAYNTARNDASKVTSKVADTVSGTARRTTDAVVLMPQRHQTQPARPLIPPNLMLLQQRNMPAKLGRKVGEQFRPGRPPNTVRCDILGAVLGAL